MSENDSANILRCPACGARDVRRSQSKRMLDSLMLLLRRQPQRCRSCKHRFYIRVASQPPGAAESAPAADPKAHDPGAGTR